MSLINSSKKMSKWWLDTGIVSCHGKGGVDGRLLDYGEILTVLRQHTCKANSCLRVKGTSYIDLLHIWGILRAGYIPQMISLRMTSPQVVYELLKEGNAVALLCEPTFQDILKDSPLPVFPAGDIDSSQDTSSLPNVWTPTSADDTTMILHSSGSTSGIPKLVPCTAKWMDLNIRKLRELATWSRLGDQQETVVGG